MLKIEVNVEIITIGDEKPIKEYLTEEKIKKAMTDKSIFQITLEEKDKEIEKLKENWKELKEIIQEQINNPLNVEMKIFSKMVLNDMETIERIERR